MAHQLTHISRVLVVVLVAVIAAACQSPVEPSEPRPFTLGPGCVGTKVVTQDLRGGAGRVTYTIDGHWPACPDPLPEGWTLKHWDTTFVSAP